MAALKYERVWTQKNKYDDAECEYHTTLARLQNCNGFPPKTDPDVTIYPQPIFPTNCNSALIDLDRNEKAADSNPPKKSKKERKRSNNSQMDNKVMSAIENLSDMSIDKQLRAKEAKEKRNKADKKNMQMKEVASLDMQLKEIMSADNIVIQPQVQVQAPATISPKKSRKSKKDKSKSKSPPKEVAPAPIDIIDPITLDVKDNKFYKDNDKCDDGNRIQRCSAMKISPPMKGETPQAVPSGYSLAQEVAKARQHIKNSLECMDSVAELAGSPNEEVTNKLNSLEKSNADLRSLVESLQSMVIGLQKRVQDLEGGKPAPAAKAAKPKEDSDDGVDLFASDSDDDQEAVKVREQRLAAYAEKKSKKPVLIAKSNIILDVKTWSDEIDMKELETEVRKVAIDGLLWGASKLVPLAFGVHKLQISCVVEDDKVSIDWLQEEIEKLEDLVQSVDIAAFNKV